MTTTRMTPATAQTTTPPMMLDKGNGSSSAWVGFVRLVTGSERLMGGEVKLWKRGVFFYLTFLS